MLFNDHSELQALDLHARLAASKYSWMDYDEDKMTRVYLTEKNTRRGTRLHTWAAETIRLRIKQIDAPLTLNLYVNDCIGFQMTPEKMLFVNEHAFGTPDAVGYNERQKKLRISDLKTGFTPTSEKQLEAYAAFFCLEYGFNPMHIVIELRIYQLDECRLYVADPDRIFHIMETIRQHSKLLTELRKEEDLEL